MCTAITLTLDESQHVLGRNYDWNTIYNPAIILTPRNYIYTNKITKETIAVKYALLGMNIQYEPTSFYVDGVNEKGLSCCVLSLAGHSSWNDQMIEGKENIISYDVIFWILANFATLEEVKEGVKRLNIYASSEDIFSSMVDIHWIVADKSGKSIVIEKTQKKLTVYNNKIGVLTNAPTFDFQLNNLNRYINLETIQPQPVKWGEQILKADSHGYGLIGLPGDFSSPSRFIRAAFLRNHVRINQDNNAIIQSFHILENLSVATGINRFIGDEANLEPYTSCLATQYTSCMDLDNLIYYYRTYHNPQILAIDFKKEKLDLPDIKRFAYHNEYSIKYQN